MAQRGLVAESLHWVATMLESAQVYQDPDLQISGHAAAALSYLWLGAPITCRDHADQVSSGYSEGRHRHLVDIMNWDPKTLGLGYLAEATWILGYPEKAVKIREAGEIHARKLGHSFNLVVDLTEAARLFDFRGELAESLRRLQEAERLGRENSMPFVTEFLVPGHSGNALIHGGQAAEGRASLGRGIALWEGGTATARTKRTAARKPS